MKFFGVFDADVIWTLVPICSALWSLGGSGLKLLRRIGVPVAIAFYAIGYGVPVFVIETYFIIAIAIITFGPGYGDDFEDLLGVFYWPYLAILGALYGASNAGLALHGHDWLSLGIGSGATSILFVGTMRASKSWTWFEWKWAEMIVGGSVGLTAAMVIK